MIFRATLLLALSASVAAEQLRINAGGPALPSIGWRKDTAKFRSGSTTQYETTTEVAASGSWKPVYRSHAYSTSGYMYYIIPVNDGIYDVHLLFAEVYYNTADARVFSVRVNGRRVYAALDVVKEAGGAYKPLYVSVRGVRVINGLISVHLARYSGKGNPMLSGLVIDGANVTAKVGREGISGLSIPAPSPSASPSGLRLCTTGRKENEFSMNVGPGKSLNSEFGGENTKYIDGSPGVAVVSEGTGSVPGGYRYAYENDLTYRIPVPQGRYTVTTFHAEEHFTATGKRAFDIVINGITVASKVDVFAAAGGTGKPLVLSFANIASVSGLLTISFSKVTENPFVNALRITGSGADTIAIGGDYGGTCRYPLPSPSVSPVSIASPSPFSGPVICDVAKTQIGRIPKYFFMNIGGPAVANVGYGAENVNYIVGERGHKASTSASVVPPPGHNKKVAGVYKTERYTSEASLTYKIPVPNVGVYNIRTFHAETYFNAAGKRVFNVVINGIVKMKNVDVFKTAGGKNKGIALEFFHVPPVNGFLTISFTKNVENPFVNAIDILGYRAHTLAIPGLEDGSCKDRSPRVSPSPVVTSPTPVPVCDVAKTLTGRPAKKFRMNIGGPALASIDFGAENVNYIVGSRGVKAVSSGRVLTRKWSLNEDLYKTEKYTREAALTYKIPVPKKGIYTITTFHAETFFDAPGQRLFNIVVNGVLQRKNLDVFVAAGGKNKALVLGVHRGPAVDGFITISFTKVVENPFVNAIEIYGDGADTIAVAGLEDGSC